MRVQTTASDSVDNENVAFARSRCERCRTVAAAMQAVLITSNASDIQPKNVAVALNEECTSCLTFAAAYQYVVTTDGPTHFDREGRARIRDIRERVAEAVESDLAFPELRARLDALYDEFRTTVKAELSEEGRRVEGETLERTDAER